MKNDYSTKIRLALTAAAITAADQLSKYFFIQDRYSGWPWPGFFEFTSHRNYGLIANLAVPQPIILAVTLAVVLVILQRIFISKEERTPNEGVALALVLGGALGNLIDRLRLGYVDDWAMFFGISIVNFADAAIAFGLLWYALTVGLKPSPTKG